MDANQIYEYLQTMGEGAIILVFLGIGVIVFFLIQTYWKKRDVADISQKAPDTKEGGGDTSGEGGDG